MSELTNIQLDILNSCVDGDELFYFLFAEVNYGGQVFSSRLKETNDSFHQYNDRVYHIKCPANVIISEIIKLIKSGYLKCWYVDDKNNYVEIIPDNKDLSVYLDYNCLLFEDHMDKYGGYGPHVFEATKKGIEAVQNQEW
jgi:hypothetical protein